MPNTVDITIRTKAELAGLQRAQQVFARFGEYIKQGIGFQVANLASRIPQQFVAMVRGGVEFNAQLESAQLGLAGILRQFQGREYKNFADALAASGALVGQLQEQARTTVATFEDLLTAFQSIAGAAFAANIPLEKQVGLTVLLSQAVSGLGIQGRGQLAQESVALLTGNIGPDARLARALGITGPMVQQARAQGQLYEFLTAKLAALGEAGARAGKTFAGAASNLTDAWQQVRAEATRGAFDNLKQVILDLTQRISTPEFKSGLESLGNLTTKMIELSAKAATTAVEQPLGAGATAAATVLATGMLWARTRAIMAAVLGSPVVAIPATAWTGWQAGRSLSGWFGRWSGLDTGDDKRESEDAVNARISARWSAMSFRRSPAPAASGDPYAAAFAQARTNYGSMLAAMFERLSAPAQELRGRTMFQSFGEMRAASSSLNIGRAMLAEVREIRDALRRGLPLDPATL